MLKRAKKENTRRLPKKTVLVLCFLTLSGLIRLNPPLAHASASGNIIINPSFEQGLDPQGIPVGWDLTGCEGVANANVTLDQTRWVDGIQSAKITTGPVTPTYCFPDSSGPRPVGFVQFRQFLTNYPNLRFSNLTDSPSGFSFWFNLQPYGTGMAGFEVRIFGTESNDELDYVFDPDPSIGTYTNYTNPPNPGLRSLIFQGYQPGQWYHFSRNLLADWTTLNLNTSGIFSILQFQGFASQIGTQLKSTIFWLDDVRVYAGSQLPPTETHWTIFNFTDTKGNIVDSKVRWKILDSTGQTVTYIQGQNSLSTAPYWVQVYYQDYSATTLITSEQIHLDTRITIPLTMIPNNSVIGNYIVLNNPVANLTVYHPNSPAPQFIVQGTIGTEYAMLLGVATQPALIQGNGIDLRSGIDWTYDPTVSFTRIQFSMPFGTENITLFFNVPQRQPLITFNDITGTALKNQITFQILDSRGGIVPYSPGKILPAGTFLVEAYYEGYRIYRSPLETNQSTPITLEMLPLGATGNSYLALNSTVTDITAGVSSSRISFQVEGSGPYLIVVNVDKKPLRVEKDGLLIASWVYNATTGTVSIETATPGSFQLVLVESPSYDYLYMGGAIATVILAGAIGIVLWRMRIPKKLPSD